MHVNFYFSNTNICQKTSVGRQLPVDEDVMEVVVLTGDEKSSSPCKNSILAQAERQVREGQRACLLLLG